MTKSEITIELCGFLNEMESRLGETNKQSIRHGIVTSRVIKIVLLIMFVLALVNGFLLLVLSEGLDNSLKNVETMAAQFTSIAKDMTGVTQTVGLINNEVSYLPMLASDTGLITQDMSIIGEEMHTIVNLVNDIDKSVYRIDNSIGYMDFRLMGVAQDTFQLSDSVSSMTLPSDWVNWISPWQ